MACIQPNLPRLPDPIANIIPIDISGASMSETNRRLMYTGNPETIMTTDFGTTPIITLWHDRVTGRNRVSYRIIVWHVNGLGHNIKVGITVGNGSTTDTYRADGLRIQEGITGTPGFPDFIAVGLCCAKALIGNTLDSIVPADATFLPNRVSLLREWIVPPGRLIGAIIEFDLVNITSTVNSLNYRIRSVASNGTTQNLRLHQGNIPVTPREHGRGSWDFAGVQGNVITYNLGNTDLNTSISNRTTDALFTDVASFDPSNARSLWAQVGARYRVTVRLHNPSGVTRTGVILFNGRGGLYSGAVRIDNGATNGVPMLQIFDNGTRQAVEVARRTIVGGGTVDVALEISHAGATYTPLGILCRTV